MANNVFANNLEIACKAGEGISAAAFPDPCWSPPPPSAGPVVIPYANTAKASDTANGSKTVFISGKPIMLRDKSYFKTSTGNEPATYAFNKGQKTGKLKGACYFASWSMNVKIEGYNVVRHSDDTTHNHGSHPGNTGKWPFTDSKIQKKACKKEIEREGVACGGLKPKKVDKRGKVQKPWFESAYKDVKGKVKWKRKHCVGLGVMPRSLDTKDLTSLKKKLNNKLSDFNAIDDAIDVAADQAIEIVEDKITKLIAKGVAKKVVGAAAGFSGIGLVITAIAAADAVKDALDLTGMYGDLENMHSEAKRIKMQLGGVKREAW